MTSAPRSRSLSTGTSTSSKGTSSSSGLWQTRMGASAGRQRSTAFSRNRTRSVLDGGPSKLSPRSSSSPKTFGMDGAS